jgi:type II secretory pathway pseudopilin PulG
MKPSRQFKVESRGTPAGALASRPSPRGSRPVSAFTLIEIMLVVALIALISTTAIPSIYQLSKKEGMRRAVQDLLDVCENARAQAVFSGKAVAIVFYPPERRFGISGSPSAGVDPETGEARPAPDARPGTGLTGTIPDDITLEMLDVNQSEYKDSETAVVWFYPNGTCEELTLNYRSEKGEFRWIKLEPATSMLIQGEKP